MTDRELLELAAKAYFDDAPKHIGEGVLDWVRDCVGEWNPLTDDGDALRLAVRLNISFMVASPYSYAGVSFDESEKVCEKHKDSDPYAATRRAIVRAAAEIGKESK